MKNRLIAITLITTTAAAIGAYPMLDSTRQADPVMRPIGIQQPLHQQHPKIDLVFALDTTGSMDGLIAAAKEKIWSIASSMANGDPAPEIRMGLVAYRDRGDAYVTRVFDLSTDMDSVYAQLMEFRAEGGGDTPESVNQALNDALNKISWSQDENAYKVIFLVGDAPPHMDYSNDRRYPELLREAGKQRILVNAVQCGTSSATRQTWQRIAQLGGGAFFAVDQQGSALALSSPFDREIAALSERLDDTRLYYGTSEQKERQQRKLMAARKVHKEASVESRARRATYNLSKSGASNFLGENELVDEVISGRISLDQIDSTALPAPMQAMTPAARQNLIEEKSEARKKLQSQLQELNRERAAFLEKKVDALGGSETSLGHKIQSTVRAQAAERGIRYDADKLNY